MHSKIIAGFLSLFMQQEKEPAVTPAGKLIRKECSYLSSIIPVVELQNLILSYLPDWEEIQEFHAENAIHSLEFSLDGQYVASGSYRGELCFFRFCKGELKLLQCAKIDSFAIEQLAFSPDGNYLAARCNGGYINIYTLVNDKLCFFEQIKPNACLIQSIAFHKTFFAYAIEDSSNKHKAIIGTLSKNKNYTVVQERLFDTPILQMSFSPNDKFVVFGLAKSIEFCESLDNKLKLIKTIPINGQIRGIAISPDSQLIIVSYTRYPDQQAIIIMFQCGHGKFELIQILEINIADLFSNKCSMNHNSMACSGKYLSAGFGNKLQIWQLKNKQLEPVQSCKIGQFHVLKTTFSPQGTYLLTGSNFAPIKLWHNQKLELMDK